MKGIVIRTTVAAALALLVGATAQAGFHRGDFYASNFFSNTIVHYDSSGTVVGPLSIPTSVSSDLRGLAFGPDRRLYVVAGRSQGFAVLVLDPHGTVRQTYEFPQGFISGNISYGKIAFDDNGSFFVGTGSGLVRFDLGDPASGTLVTSGEVFAVKALPSGNLLIASSYTISEVTNTGSLVRTIDGGVFFVDLRGLEYDPASDTIFATMLGYTGNFFQLMALDGTSGQLLASTSFWYGDDIVRTPDGYLIVGSRTQSPGVFTEDLTQVGLFAGDSRMFVTEVPRHRPHRQHGGQAPGD